ncbi:MAG: TrkA family potassium uptake protein [Anaerolineales bacterium]|nr:TrkA family potassium uptake protein [Anaerolineales bacterium]MDW8446760.1 TrkA family potassium uptake protein [Anaerolineales bacterium]
MKIIVMGCGRVGEQFARLMDAEGHDVTVVDTDEAALERMRQGFGGKVILGVGFDRQVLIQAGIERAEAFAATSNSDNANIIAARIARNIFHVPKVVASVYDPRRAEIYRRLGLLTFSSTALGAERVRELLTYQELEPMMTFGSGEVALVNLEASPLLDRKQVRDLTVPGEIHVIAISRQGQAILPLQGTIIRNRDLIYIAVHTAALERLKALIGYA